MPDVPHDDHSELHAAVRRIEAAIVAAPAEPAWRTTTKGEPRWVVSLAIVAAIVLQVTLPSKLAMPPRWLLPALGTVLLEGLLVANPSRIDRRERPIRVASIVLTALLSIGNAVSAVRLVVELVDGTLGATAPRLLLYGGAVWLINVVVFALWYWELDRGGPAARAHGVHRYPDFLFPPMTSPDLAPPDWEPQFVDYLYLAFTNATAFSPTDTLPNARWAKLAMMLQSAVSLATLALVIARAINILQQ